VARRKARLVLKWLLAIVGTLLAIPAAFALYLYATHVSEETTAGSAYGFTIGDSKESIYTAIQHLVQRGDALGVEGSRTREEEERLHPGAGEYFPVAELETRFDEWNHWSLWVDTSGSPPIGLLLFEGDSLSSAGPVGATRGEWHPPGAPHIAFTAGQSYEEAYDELGRLAEAPGYESLRLRSGWTARRQPHALDDSEFALIEPYDRWKVFVGNERSHRDFIRLTFENRQLASIYRHRQNFELP